MFAKLTSSAIHIAAAVLAGSVLIGAGAADAAARLTARVSLSSQTMHVLVDGRTAFEWKVSTGAKGYGTPVGAFRPIRMHEMWRSRKYDNAPMPHSVFFHGGYAVHGTSQVSRLGRAASHGCVRLAPEQAEDFYWLVKGFGAANTRIEIVR